MDRPASTAQEGAPDSAELARQEALVRDHIGPMMAVARRLLANEEDARDCVQDAFIRAITKLDSFEGRSSIRTWLHRIVVNTALGHLRKRKRRGEASIDDLMPDFDANGCRIEPSWRFEEPVEKSLEKRETKKLVRESIERLPESYRIVLVLRDIEGYDTAEVAEMLETNVGVIKTRLHRARAALKKLLEPLWLEGGL